MGDTSKNSAVTLDPSSTLEPSPGSAHQRSQTPRPPPALEEPPDNLDVWKTIGEQDFDNEKDFLYPSRNLTSKKLKNRNGEDVVIFDYSLSSADENPPVEGGGPSSGGFSEEGNIFFQVPKEKLIESKQLTKEVRVIRSRGPRLDIM